MKYLILLALVSLCACTTTYDYQDQLLKCKTTQKDLYDACTMLWQMEMQCEAAVADCEDAEAEAPISTIKGY